MLRAIAGADEYAARQVEFLANGEETLLSHPTKWDDLGGHEKQAINEAFCQYMAPLVSTGRLQYLR